MERLDCVLICILVLVTVHLIFFLDPSRPSIPLPPTYLLYFASLASFCLLCYTTHVAVHGWRASELQERLRWNQCRYFDREHCALVGDANEVFYSRWPPPLRLSRYDSFDSWVELTISSMRLLHE